MSGLPEIEEVGAAHRQQLRNLTVEWRYGSA